MLLINKSEIGLTFILINNVMPYHTHTYYTNHLRKTTSKEQNLKGRQTLKENDNKGRQPKRKQTSNKEYLKDLQEDNFIDNND